MIVTAQRRRRRLGYYNPVSAAGNPVNPLSFSPDMPDTGIFDLPGGINLQNLKTGTLSPAQVAAIQSQGVQDQIAVYNNTVANYGADSPAAQAVLAILPSQIAGVNSDIAALNPQSSDPLLAMTGIPWYYWAGLAAGIFLLVKR